MVGLVNASLLTAPLFPLKVYITAKHVSNDSKANIDNIFFKEDYCDPVPEKSQGMF